MAFKATFRTVCAAAVCFLLLGSLLFVAPPVRGATPVRLTEGDFWQYRWASAFAEEGISFSLSGSSRYDVLGSTSVQAGAQFYDVYQARVNGSGTFSGNVTILFIRISVTGVWSLSGELWLNRSDLGTVRDLTTMMINITTAGFPVGFEDTTDLRYEPPAGMTYRPEPLAEGLIWSRHTDQVDNETGGTTPMWWNYTVGARAPLTVQSKPYSAFPVTVRTSEDSDAYQILSIDPSVGMPVKIVTYADATTPAMTLELIDHRYAQQRDEVLFTLAMSLAIVAAVGVIAAVMAAVLLRSRRARPPGGPAAPPPGPPVPPPLGPPGGGAPP